MMMFASSANAGGWSFKSSLSRAQTTDNVTTGLIKDAEVKITFSEDFSEAKVKMKIEGGDKVVAAHFHCAPAGMPGFISVDIIGALDGKIFITNADVAIVAGQCADVGINNLVSLAFAMKDGLIYANIHTLDNLGGEVRGQMIGD